MEEKVQSCCFELKKRLLRSEEKRDALRQGVNLLTQQVDKVQDENLRLKNELEKEKLQLKLEKEGKEKEASLREDLDKEINNLRMEISSLQKKDCLKKTDENQNQPFETRILEGQAEIKRLKQLLAKEKKKCELEKKKTEVEKNGAKETRIMLEIERGEVEEGKRLTELERKRAKEYQDCLEKCKLEVTEAREKLAVERSKTCDVRKKVEAERQNVIKEKKQADIERMRAEEAMQRAEANCKNANNEKACADLLSKQLGCERKKLECLQNEMEGMLSSNKVKDLCFLENETYTIDDQRQKMGLLKDKLKFEKKKVKHAKGVTKLQEAENNLLRRRFHLLKQEFINLSRNLSLIGSQFSQSVDNIDVMAKMDPPSKPRQKNLNDDFGCKLYNYGSQGTNELSFNIENSSRDTTRECNEHLFPGLGGNIFYPVSGITSDLESPIRCSVRRKSQSSVACSTSASFSDRTFMGSQETQTMEPNRRKKKRKIEGVLDSVKSMYLEAKKMRSMIGENLSMMINLKFEIKSFPMLVSQSNELPKPLDSRQTFSGNLTDFDKNKRMESKKKDTNSVPLDNTINGNCTKLQEIDNGADEERLGVDVARPLSPLPFLNFPEFIGGDSHLIQSQKENLSLLFTSKPDHTNIHNEETLNTGGNHSATDPELADSAPKIISNQCGTANGFWHQTTSTFCVICFNSKDAGGISRIFQAMDTIIFQTSMISQSTDILAGILSAFSFCEDLSSMEIDSVLFSLLLNYASGQLSANPGCSFSGEDACSWSLEAELNAHSDLQTQFLEACKIDCLVTLMENFLLHKEICTYKTHENVLNKDNLGATRYRFSKENVHISSESASVIQLVAGSMILASICKVFKHISFLWKLSYRILRTPRSNLSCVLTLLHTFASVCGESFFSAAENNLSTVVKSVVLHLELGQGSSSRLHSAENLPTCKDCPFSQGALLLDKLFPFLMTELEHHLSGTSKLNSRKTECVSETLENSAGGNCDTSCLIQKYEEVTCQSNHVASRTLLCSFVDHLSLLELTVCYADWHWTFENVIPSLFKMAHSCSVEIYSSALIMLIGNFGRLGVDAFGYEHHQVIELRKRISMFLDSSDGGNRRSSGFLKGGIATVSAILNLLPLSFKEICGIEFEAKACVCSQNIRIWFSQLNENHKLLCINIFGQCTELV